MNLENQEDVMNKSAETFLDVIKYISRLPEYAGRKESLEKAVSEWRKRVPLIDQVVRRKTTFEKAISFIVNENLALSYWSYRHGVCSTPAYEQLARNLQERFRKIFPFSTNQIWPIEPDLTRALISPFTSCLQQLRISLMLIMSCGVVGSTMVFMLVNFEPSTTIDQVWVLSLFAFLLPSLFMVVMIVLVIFNKHETSVSRRKDIARILLERAKYLDGVISELPDKF